MDKHTHRPKHNSLEKNCVTRNTRLSSPGLLRASRWVSDAKETNYGNPTHQPKVMFTFGVNSVCACALAYLCVHWSLGKEFNAWACLCEYGLFAYLREHKKQRCKAEVPKISQKSLWKCHKGISWMSVGLWEMGFDTTQSWLGRVGGYMAIVAQLWLVEHLRFYDLLPFGALGYSRVPTT